MDSGLDSVRTLKTVPVLPSYIAGRFNDVMITTNIPNTESGE